jgi:hypothetical protein
MTDSRPIVKNAPGLVWRKHKGGWEGLWRARADLVEDGYEPKNKRLWFGLTLTEREAAAISDECRSLQDSMLLWGRDAPKKVFVYDGTLQALIQCYMTDPDSTFHKRRYHTRENTRSTLLRIVKRWGEQPLAKAGDDPGINARLLLAWHKEWSDGGAKVSAGHGLISILRTVFAFGATILEDPECERLCGVLHKMRFPMGKPRTEFLVAEQVEIIRKTAHGFGYHSIALANAMQFDLILRQKDVIGEWVPIDEPGLSDVTWERWKWLRGIRWSEIDDDLILRHTTSKKNKFLEVDLKLAPMVMEELMWNIETYHDGVRPSQGPVVICEATLKPWLASEFRRKWRLIADAAKIPKSVRNMDSRSGGISEADEAGVNMEHVRKASTHSQVSQTQNYARGVRASADSV